MKTIQFKKALFIILSTLLTTITIHPLLSIKAISDFHLIIAFDSEYDSSQGKLEYQLNEESWQIVTENQDIQVMDDVSSITFKVVPNEYHEVNFDNGPELDGPTHISFNAGDAEDARNALVGSGYQVQLSDSFESISLTGISFREASSANQANISVSIKGRDIEFWEADIPSRITFLLPGSEEFKFGSDNLTWEDGILPPNATGVCTTNPVVFPYEYDNSGNISLTYQISNANTKITSFKINNIDYINQCPQSDEEILKNIDDGGRNTKPVTISNIPYAADYNIEIAAESHDLMGGFGWNYLPEVTLSGDKREDCIAHGTLTFIKGEYNGNTYNSVSEWNQEEAYGTHLFKWIDGNKDYVDEHDAWGEASFPKGAKITMKLIPDAGYQLTSLYGDENIEPQEEPGVYTITMNGGMNSHLLATFENIEDAVTINSSSVTSCSISNLENSYGEGTMKLNVEDADISEASRDNFEEIATEENAEMKEYIDINLDNTIYKATNNPNEAWDRSVTELDSPATITLALVNDYQNEEIILIHEHENQYEIIPVTYDSSQNTIAFETDKFSNYVIATKKNEETPEPTPDEPTPTPTPEPTPDEIINQDVTYTIPTKDNSFIVEVTDEDGKDFQFEVIEFLKLNDNELTNMGISKQMFDEIKNQVEQMTKPRGNLLGLYEMILTCDGQDYSGTGPFVLRIKLNETLQNYTDFKLTSLNGFGDDGYTLQEAIEMIENDGYLVATVDQLGTFVLNATLNQKDDDSQKKSIPDTSDETNLFFWIILLGLSSCGIIYTRKALNQ